MTKTSQRAKTAAVKAQKTAPAPEKDVTESFLREVDDVMQQEKLLAFWRTWRVAIIGGVLGLLAIVAGWQGWQAYELHGIQQTAKAWHDAEALDGDAQVAAYRAILADGHGGYRALAAFKLADREADPAGADKLYALIYDDSGQDKWVRDLARVNAGMRYLGVDDGAAGSHFSLLAQHNAGETPNAATALALEQLAWLAVRSGDLASAKGYAGQLIALPGVPADMVQRVGRILGLAG